MCASDEGWADLSRNIDNVHYSKKLYEYIIGERLCLDYKYLFMLATLPPNVPASPAQHPM